MRRAYRRRRCGVARSSRRHVRARVSADHLWRLSKGAQESPAHAVTVGKTCLPGDDINRMAALLHHQARGLDAQVFDCLGRRLAGFDLERTAELARA
jgi:hypothetical protein